MHRTAPSHHSHRDHAPIGPHWDTTRLRSDTVIAGVAAVCVAVPAWAVTGSAAITALTALATVTAIALATVMI